MFYLEILLVDVLHEFLDLTEDQRRYVVLYPKHSDGFDTYLTRFGIVFLAEIEEISANVKSKHRRGG
jgi:hypothetical protein